MRLNDIRRKLRSGVAPTEFDGVKLLGSGIDRTAYQIGPFVVKGSSKYNGPDRLSIKRQLLRDVGVRPAPTVKVRTEAGYSWDIQLAYSPLMWPDYGGWYDSPSWKAAAGGRVYLDVHAGNIGYDRRNRFVAFDY